MTCQTAWQAARLRCNINAEHVSSSICALPLQWRRCRWSASAAAAQHVVAQGLVLRVVLPLDLHQICILSSAGHKHCGLKSQPSSLSPSDESAEESALMNGNTFDIRYALCKCTYLVLEAFLAERLALFIIHRRTQPLEHKHRLQLQQCNSRSSASAFQGRLQEVWCTTGFACSCTNQTLHGSLQVQRHWQQETSDAALCHDSDGTTPSPPVRVRRRPPRNQLPHPRAHLPTARAARCRRRPC